MSILSGYGKFKRYVLTNTGYKLCSQWTSSNTVHFDDGNTAQTKVGAINGITDSLTSTSSNVALSAKSGKSLQDQITSLNTGIVDINDTINGVILWENPNVSVPFSAGTGALNDSVSNYDYLEIVWCMTAESPNFRYTTGKINNTSFSLRFEGDYLYNRAVSITGKSVSFDACKYRTTLGGALTIGNNVIIPYQIIGYKKAQFESIPGIFPDASNLFYNNKKSGLAADNVQDAIDEINFATKINTSTNAFTFAEGHLYTSAIFKKCNNIVYAKITAAMSSYAQNELNFVGTIADSDYRPNQEFLIPCAGQSGSGKQGLGYLIVGANGEISYVPITDNSLNWLNATITYFT